MNKKEKSLTWKYFWQQKAKEIILTLLIIGIIIFIPYILGHNIGDGEDIDCGGEFIKTVFKDVPFTSQNYWALNECLTIEEWAEGCIYILIITIGVFVLWIILTILYDVIGYWLNSNWEKASKKAKVNIRQIKIRSKRK